MKRCALGAKWSSSRGLPSESSGLLSRRGRRRHGGSETEPSFEAVPPVMVQKLLIVASATHIFASEQTEVQSVWMDG